MFTKLEMVGAIAISLFGGFAIGYSKAREICLQAIITATGEQKEPETTEKEETPKQGLSPFRTNHSTFYGRIHI